MNKLITTGRIMFAAGMASLGIICIIAKDFIIGRPPAWPDGFQVNPPLAYISGTIVVIAAIAILFKIKETFAALLIAALIFLLSVLRHLPHFMDDWANSYKSMALFGGALIIAGSGFREDGNGTMPSKGKENLKKGFVVTGSVLLAAFFIACGYAHFNSAAFVKDFIPNYIPFHLFFTYFCAVCLFAGGIGILIPQTRRLAALLSGIMILGWFILLHIPRFAANPNDPSDRMGLFESFTFIGIFFVLAGIFSRKN